MLKSMTGHGQAAANQNGYTVHAELRCVNSRYFKLSLRAPEGHGWLEQRIEALLRSVIQRGSIQATLNVAAPHAEMTHNVNLDLLRYYAAQIAKLTAELELKPGATVVDLLQLPGAVVETDERPDDEQVVWPAVEDAVRLAVQNLDQMRCAEGRAMAEDFMANLTSLGQYADRIREKAPIVVTEYQARLADRLQQLQAGRGFEVESQDLAREVALFADRCDISEELVRLESHMRQFREVLEAETPAGKKLEFIIQEMFRETNTIGSKAGNLAIGRHVIELKTIIERMREMVQNVE